MLDTDPSLLARPFRRLAAQELPHTFGGSHTSKRPGRRATRYAGWVPISKPFFSMYLDLVVREWSPQERPPSKIFRPRGGSLQDPFHAYNWLEKSALNARESLERAGSGLVEPTEADGFLG